MHRPYLLILLLPVACSFQASAQERFQSDWPQLRRTWVGPEFWANRLQDWHIAEGRLECLNGRMAERTVHLLTHRIAERAGDVQLTVRTGLIDPQKGHSPVMFLSVVMVAPHDSQPKF